MVEYVTTDESGLDCIRTLWEALNRHHLASTRHFSGHYLARSFDGRKSEILKKAVTGTVRIEIAQEPGTRQPAGYCIVSLSPDGTGEIDSIFVDGPFRDRGIGSRLMERALLWFSSSGAKRIVVSVSYGNEEAWAFYEKFGFRPRMTVLEKCDDAL
jgi:ribosomal protein S18 acetylase RimI-like enzyme